MIAKCLLPGRLRVRERARLTAAVGTTANGSGFAACFCTRGAFFGGCYASQREAVYPPAAAAFLGAAFAGAEAGVDLAALRIIFCCSYRIL